MRSYVKPTCELDEIQDCLVMVPYSIGQTLLKMICMFLILFSVILIIAELARRSQDRSVTFYFITHPSLEDFITGTMEEELY